MNIESSQPGVFAVGDVQPGDMKRVAAGVGMRGISVSHINAFVNKQAAPEKNRCMRQKNAK
jgi:thioredoxin reductase